MDTLIEIEAKKATKLLRQELGKKLMEDEGFLASDELEDARTVFVMAITLLKNKNIPEFRNAMSKRLMNFHAKRCGEYSEFYRLVLNVADHVGLLLREAENEN